MSITVECGSTTTKIYEIRPYSEPEYKVEKIYPVINNYGVKSGYDLITINYFDTSVQKLYKINDGEWTLYNNQKIKLETSQTIYMKGIDKNGVETKTVSYTSSLPSDTLSKAAYDGDVSTAASIQRCNTAVLNIDSSMYGKKIHVKSGNTLSYLIVDKAGKTLYSAKLGAIDRVLTTIPGNSAKLSITVECGSTTTKIYEIAPVTE